MALFKHHFIIHTLEIRQVLIVLLLDRLLISMKLRGNVSRNRTFVRRLLRLGHERA